MIWQSCKHSLVLTDEVSSVLVNAHAGTKVQARNLDAAAQLANGSDATLTIGDIGAGLAEVWLPVVTGDELGDDASENRESHLEHTHRG